MRQVKPLNIISVILQQSTIAYFSLSVIIVSPDVQAFAKLIKLRAFLPKALKKDIENITISIAGTNKRSSFRIRKIKHSCDYSN
jgi:hypothetical protein